MTTKYDAIIIGTGQSGPSLAARLAGCYQGLTFTGGSAELGRATTDTVVVIGISVLVADYLLTQLFFLF